MDSSSNSEKRNHSRWCSAIGCANSKGKNENLVFFRFPKDMERCRRWIQNIRRQDLIGADPIHLNRCNVLCENHFETSQFMNPADKGAGKKGIRLMPFAVPTLFPVLSNPPPLVTLKRPLTDRSNATVPQPKCRKTSLSHKHVTDCHSVTEGSESAPDSICNASTSNSRPVIRNLQSKIYRLKRKVKTLKKNLHSAKEKCVRTPKDFVAAAGRFVNGPSLAFLKAQVLRKKGSRKPWDNDQKRIALSLYYKNPNAYKLMCNLFCLPTVRTLQKTLKLIDTGTGINSQVLQALAIKAQNMPEMAKLCVLSFDEMAIKRNLTYSNSSDSVEGLEDLGLIGKTKQFASQALVFMIRGITHPWKQPISYYFSSSTMRGEIMQDLLVEAIRSVSRIGYSVEALVCDQGANNRSMLEGHFGVHVDHPSITIDGKTIFVFYDPPHLLKNTRNNLMKQNMMVGDCEVKWDHIVQFHECDSKLPVRMAPKLSEKHINLPPFTNMRVNLAAQVLSHTVSAGMMALCFLQKLPQEAVQTASYVERFDKLFDTFNSRTVSGPNQYRRALSSTSVHLTFINETLKWLDTVTPSKGKPLPFLNGWKISLRSLLLLWDKLNTHNNLTFLLTSRLNQDCLENFFSIVRQRGGNRDNPDAGQFKAAYKQVSMNNLINPPKGANCQPDSDSFMLELGRLSSTVTNTPICLNSDNCTVNNTDELNNAIEEIPDVPANDDMAKLEILTYIAGYILKKVPHVKDCDHCKIRLFKKDLCYRLEPQYTCMYFKAYTNNKGDFGGLQVASSELVQMLTRWENEFERSFLNSLHLDGIRQRVLSAITRKLDTTSSDECYQALRKMITIYLTIRIHFALKTMSRDANSKLKGKRNRKALKITHS